MNPIRIEAAGAAVRAERRRQTEVEGWTPEHDDAHEDGAMLRAAVLYYQHAARPDMPLQFRPDGAPMGWPWEAQWWKPKNPQRDLERAGALALAERDRLRRKHSNTEPAMQKFRIIIEALADLPVAA